MAEGFNNQDLEAHDIHLYFEMGKREPSDPAMVEELRTDFQEATLRSRTPTTEPETDEPLRTPKFKIRKETFIKIVDGQPYKIDGLRLIDPNFDPRLVIHIYKTKKGWIIDLNGITQTPLGEEMRTYAKASVYVNQMALRLTKKVQQTLEAEMREKRNLH